MFNFDAWSPLKKDRVGTLCMYLATMFWGSTFIFQKILLQNDVPPFFMNGLRFSCVIITLYNVKLHLITKEAWKKGCVMGIFLFLAFSLQVYSLKTLDASVTAFLMGLTVVFTPVLNHLIFKTGLTIVNLFAILLAIVGIYFFNGNQNSGFVWSEGIIFGVFSALFYAAHVVSSSHFLKKESPIELNVLQLIVCAGLSYFGAFITQETFPTVWNPVSLAAILYLGFIGSLLCYSLQAIGQKLIENVVKVGLILTLEPIFAAILAVPIGNEQLTMYKISGMIIIFSGVLLSEWQDRKTQSQRS